LRTTGQSVNILHNAPLLDDETAVVVCDNLTRGRLRRFGGWLRIF